MKRRPSNPPEIINLEYVRPLGSGGFSDVYLYQQRLPKRQVAVKVLDANGLDRSARQAFVDEANRMAQLASHPYIVTIFSADVGTDGRPYFVMEYCSGPSLSERYKHETFGVEEVLRLGVHLSSAIAMAHAAGILHRDIKPANVLTTGFGSPALTDFGISSAVEDELTTHSTVTLSSLRDGSASTQGESVGLSVPWSPPEMFEDDPKPDVRSDVYSLAATLYTLLAGRTPFEVRTGSNSTIDLIGRIERGAVTRMDRTDLSDSFSAVLVKGMAAKRGNRYSSAMEFGRALQRVEVELGYSATPLDAGTNRIYPAAPRSPEDDEDKTHIRQIPTVVAQPDPVGAAVSTPIAAVDERTRLRDRGPDRGATVVRAGPGKTDPDGIDTVPDQRTAPLAGPRPRRRLLIGWSIALVALAVIVAGIVVGPSLANAKLEPSKSAVAHNPSIEPTPLKVLDPKVVMEPSKDMLLFTWTDPNKSKSKDRYRWFRGPNDPGGPATLSSPEVELPQTDQASLCINIVVVRDSQDSDVVQDCAQ